LVLVLAAPPAAAQQRQPLRAGQFMVEALTLENYVKFFADPYYSRVMLVTIMVACRAPSSASFSAIHCLSAGAQPNRTTKR